MREDQLPAGYVQFLAGQTRVVCTEHVRDAVTAVLGDASLYEYAAQHAKARSFSGRGLSYAVPLPGDVEQVVVRHNRHGGLLAPVTGDLFLPPTRAPLELRLSEQLRERGVPTPQVLGYAIYPGPAGLQRADVMTREVRASSDLSVALMSDDASVRQRALRAAAGLVTALSHAGARHHDLNVKNVLLRDTNGGALEAMVLDVDRVTFSTNADVLEQNLARLIRSARKWQSLHRAPVTDDELAEFARLVRNQPAAHFATLS